MNEKQEIMALMKANVNDNLNISNAFSGTRTANTANYSCWDYWHRDYYPQVIRESYPVYLQDRSEDKGKQAFEIIKTLQDKKLIKLDKVSDFIDAMDTLIKIL